MAEKRKGRGKPSANAGELARVFYPVVIAIVDVLNAADALRTSYAELSRFCEAKAGMPKRAAKKRKVR